MKKNFLLIVCALALVLGFSSCGGNAETKTEEQNQADEVLPQEEFKMIPASNVKLRGANSSLFMVAADSVKVMLLKQDSVKWDVRVNIPLKTTMSFKEYCIANKRNDNLHYIPELDGSYGADYLDSNESTIDYYVSTSDLREVVATILSGNTISDNVHLCGETYVMGVKVGQGHYEEELDKSYDKEKKAYDELFYIQINGIVLEAEENEAGKSASSYYSSYSDIYDEAVKSTQKMVDDAYKEAEKQFNDAYKNAQKQLGY